MSTKLTVKKVGEVVDREIEKLCSGETSHQNLTAISKTLNVFVKANTDALRYAKDRGEKPNIPFYNDL